MTLQMTKVQDETNKRIRAYQKRNEMSNEKTLARAITLLEREERRKK